MLREALAKEMTDPRFLADMKGSAQIDTYHIGADEVAQRFAAMINQPAEVVDADGEISQSSGNRIFARSVHRPRLRGDEG